MVCGHRHLLPNIPRQKAYLYIFLTFLTASLLYLYSYPLEADNWNYMKPITNMFDSFYKESTSIAILDDSSSKDSNSVTSDNYKHKDGHLKKHENSKTVSPTEYRAELKYSTSGVNELFGDKTPLIGVQDEEFLILKKIFETETFTTTSESLKHSEAYENDITENFQTNDMSEFILTGAGDNEHVERTTKVPKNLERSMDDFIDEILLPATKNYEPEENRITKVTSSTETNKLANQNKEPAEDRITKITSSTGTNKLANQPAEDRIAKVASSTGTNKVATNTNHFPSSRKISTITTGIISDSEIIHKLGKFTETEKIGHTDKLEIGHRETKRTYTTSDYLGNKEITQNTSPDPVTLGTIPFIDELDNAAKTPGGQLRNDKTTVESFENTENFKSDPSEPITTMEKVADKKKELNNIDLTQEELAKSKKGFLVFSKNCRIPDIDPMHSSIRHLVAKTPPLDCSKDYQPLTWTEGNNLYLNKTAIYEKISGGNFSCCYRSVVRKNDGKSDNDVGYGDECVEMQDKNSVTDEFITVKCQLKNGTEFFKEFYSFIHDKPEVERRCKKTKNKSNPYSVLIIGVDAVSRLNMHRQLNATAEYLLKEIGAVEMFGFNKVGDNTFPNLVPLLTGYSEHELPSVCWKSDKLPLDRCNFLWKRFSAKGYRTFYAEDCPHISSFNYVKQGFLHQPTDYYFRNFILAYQNELGREKPLNCYKCVGSISETEAVLQWTEKFGLHFSDRPSFAFSWINSLTHDFLNMGSSGDHMYKSFFQTLYQNGALKKTIIIFLGDHGMRWGEIRKTYVGRLEERLPMLLISLPQHFQQKYPEFSENLIQNAYRLVTPFDLHATLVHTLNLDNHDWSFTNPDKVDEELATNFTKRAQSLFLPVPDDRSCDEASIAEHWCTCEESLEVDITSEIVKEVASFLVNYINNLLKTVSKKCASLLLDFISDARLWDPPFEHQGHSSEDSIYTVVIHAKPGGAAFEGTVKISGKNNN